MQEKEKNEVKILPKVTRAEKATLAYQIRQKIEMYKEQQALNKELEL